MPKQHFHVMPSHVPYPAISLQFHCWLSVYDVSRHEDYSSRSIMVICIQYVKSSLGSQQTCVSPRPQQTTCMRQLQPNPAAMIVMLRWCKQSVFACAVTGASLSSGAPTTNSLQLKVVVQPVMSTKHQHLMIWSAMVRGSLELFGLHGRLPTQAWHAVWVYCGDAEKCGAQYSECWLKHLVSSEQRPLPCLGFVSLA